MKILVINAGSSSLKYQLIDMDGEKVLAKGLAERIGIPGSLLKHKGINGEVEIQRDMRDHNDAIHMVLEALLNRAHGVVSDLSEIGAVAANGEKMPQKSTYFYPKLITGLVMNLLTEQ